MSLAGRQLCVAANGVVPERSLTHLRRIWDELRDIHHTSKADISTVSGALQRSPHDLTHEFLLGILEFSFPRFAKCVDHWADHFLSEFLPKVKDKMIEPWNNQELGFIETLNNAFVVLQSLTTKPRPLKIERQTLCNILRILEGVNKDWEGYLNDFNTISLVLKWEKMADGYPFRRSLRKILSILHAGKKLLSISSSYPVMLDANIQIIAVAPCVRSFCIPFSLDDIQSHLPSRIKTETAKQICDELHYFLRKWDSVERLQLETSQLKVEDKPCHAECNLLLHDIGPTSAATPSNFVFGSSSPSCYTCENIFSAYNRAVDILPGPAFPKLSLSRTQRKLSGTWISPCFSLLDASLSPAIEKAATSELQKEFFKYVIKRAEEYEEMMMVKEVMDTHF